MAHTNRRLSDHRRDNKVLARGTRISIVANGKKLYGTVIRSDPGGWIYPEFRDRPRGVVVPPWFRSTQVQVEEEE